MNPTLYIISLVAASSAILGMQCGMADLVAIFLLWLSVMLSLFYGGWSATNKEKIAGAIAASAAAVLLLPGNVAAQELYEPLYMFKLVWFILPVWTGCLFYSACRIRLLTVVLAFVANWALAGAAVYLLATWAIYGHFILWVHAPIIVVLAVVSMARIRFFGCTVVIVATAFLADAAVTATSFCKIAK